MVTSSGELRDVTCVGYALGTFEAEKGLTFISQEDTDKLDRIEKRIRFTMALYVQDKAKIMKNLKEMTEIIVNTPQELVPQLTVLGLNFLMVTLKPNERKFKKLGPRLESLWKDIGDDVIYLIDKYYDTQDEDAAADSYTLVVKIKEQL